jgi:hypothetical protein
VIPEYGSGVREPAGGDHAALDQDGVGRDDVVRVVIRQITASPQRGEERRGDRAAEALGCRPAPSRCVGCVRALAALAGG